LLVAVTIEELVAYQKSAGLPRRPFVLLGAAAQELG